MRNFDNKISSNCHWLSQRQFDLDMISVDRSIIHSEILYLQFLVRYFFFFLSSFLFLHDLFSRLVDIIIVIITYSFINFKFYPVIFSY